MQELNRGMTPCNIANDMAALEDAQTFPVDVKTPAELLVHSAVGKIENLFEQIRALAEEHKLPMKLQKDIMKITYPRRIMDRTSEYDYIKLAGMALMAVHFDAEFSVRVLENQYGYLQPIVDNEEMRKLDVRSAFDHVNSALDEFLEQNPDERIRKCGIACCISNHNMPNDPPYAELITMFKDGDQMSVPYWRDAFFWAILNDKVSFLRKENGCITFSQSMRDSFYRPVTCIVAELNKLYGEQNG